MSVLLGRPLSYITPDGVDALKRYRYKGEDRSLLYKHILSPLADGVVRQLPEWLAPNTITFIGLLVQIAAYVALLNYCPTFTEQGPQWAIAFAGLSLFIYSTLDNADGKQARKTGAGSPLGLLFDHGMDAINTGMVGTLTFVMATGLAGGSEAGNLRLPFALWCFTSLAFFLNTWEEFHIREFILPIVNGPSEGLVVTVGLFILTAVKGPAFWQREVNTMRPLAGLLRPFIDALRGLAGVPLSLPITNGEFTACASGFALMCTCIMNSVTVIRFYSKRGQVQQQQGGSVWRNVLSAFAQVLPMLALMFFCGRWLYEPALHKVAITHPHAWFLTAGAIFADLTSRLMVSHVCDQSYRPNYLPLLVFSFSPVLKWLSYGSPQAYALLAAFTRAIGYGKPCCAWMVEPETLLWLSFTVALASLLLFFTSSVNSIAKALDIDVFDSAKQRRRHKAALAIAAASQPVASKEGEGSPAVSSAKKTRARSASSASSARNKKKTN